MNEEILYLNGRFQALSEGRIHVEDRGFQLGDGVYEVIKVMNGTIIWLEDHLVRLKRSLEAIRLSGALVDHPLEAVLPQLVRRAGLVDGSIYVQVTRGLAPREFIFPQPPHPTVLAYARPKQVPDADEIFRGVALHAVRDQRWGRCAIKSTNLLAPVLAKEEAWEAGAQEALFISPRGLVREGGSSNVLAVMDGVVRTHPLNNRILGGITRKHVLRLARGLGFAVEERAFTLREITGGSAACSEVFTASTTKDVLPVVRIGDSVVGSGRPGPVTIAILEAMREEQAVLAGLEPPPALISPSEC
jgi:D-alanine transaminase